jgi:hypothetical protein
MFKQWWRLDETDRSSVWRLYGWFTALMCAGSVVGVLSWAAWMQNLVANYSGAAPVLTPAQRASWNAYGQYWTAAFLITYAVEFLCLSTAKLMVLDRMKDFLAKDAMSRRLAVAGRVVMAVVVLGDVVGLCGNVAAAVYYKQAGDLNAAAAAAYDANKSFSESTSFVNSSISTGTVAANAQSVQQAGEVVVLLIIIASFAVVGAACLRRVNAALRASTDEHGAVALQLRRQIGGTTAFVFVTFLLRAVFAIMNALANAQSNSREGSLCSGNNCDPSCFNNFALMQYWLILTPEFQLTVILISSPLTSLVALWGMTSQRALQLMRPSGDVSMSMRKVSEPPHANRGTDGQKQTAGSVLLPPRD